MKYKSLAKCALIIDMQAFNHACSFKARPFRLPSLEGLAGSLRSVQGGAWGAKIDLSNCYWSVHLPPAMAGAVRVAAAGTTYALVRVPFGWHQAPGLVQHPIAAVLSELPDTQVVIVQYLDDILFVGRDRQVTTRVARDTAAHLARKGFLVSPKSVLDATHSLTWMGKQLSLNRSRVAHKPEGLADIVGRWVTFSLGHCTRKPLQRLLGRIGWLARPGFSAGCFLAGARAWLRMGPPSARCVPFAVCRGLLEAIAAGGRGWEPQATEGPAIRVYTDAAECPVAPGGFFVGVWSSEGPAIRRCPPWVATQQSAELYGVVCALDMARSVGCRHVDLVMDNVGAIAQVLWGRASTLLVAQQRILRRLAHRLRWQGVSVGLRYVESALNPADCVSRWWGGGGRDMVVEARAKARVYS